MQSTSMTKREFIRKCLLCSGGMLLSPGVLRGLSSLPAGDDLWKWSKEALFYKKLDGGLQCLKCPHGCILDEGETGICRSRISHEGKMYSIAYGNPCAVHVDPIEKKPFFHFLPTTRSFSIAVAGCTFSCLNCQNWEISQFSPKETRNYDLFPERVVAECVKSGSESIAYTYSEPTTFYEYAYDIASLAKKKNIRNVWKSNGYINEEPLRKLCKVLDAANIDLKSFEESTYQKLSGGHLDPVLRTLIVLREEGVWLEITNLMVPTWTDKLDLVKRMCEWLVRSGLQACPLHFSRFTPLYKLTQLPLTPVVTLEKAMEIALAAGMQYVYIGNVPGHSAENTYCHACRKLIIERRGYQIVSKHLKGSACEYCATVIPGVWV